MYVVDMTTTRTFPMFDVTRDDEIGCCVVKFYTYDDTMRMFIRDDMPLDVQCNLMMYDQVGEMYAYTNDNDIQHVVDVVRDAIIDVRPPDAL